jgi:LPS O-antigen subunit length determinant protein (WzzB/FepE family)
VRDTKKILNNPQPKKEPKQMNKLLLSYIIGLIVGAGSVLAIVEIVLK